MEPKQQKNEIKKEKILSKTQKQELKGLCVILNALGFQTKASCEGNIKGSLDSQTPWIDIIYKDAVKDQERWNKEYNRIEKLGLIDKAKTASEKKAVYTKLNAIQNIKEKKLAKVALKLEKLLKDFYKKRDKQGLDSTIYPDVGFGGIRLGFYGGKFQAGRSETEKVAYLKKYQKEFSDFEKFLKQKYFSNK